LEIIAIKILTDTFGQIDGGFVDIVKKHKEEIRRIICQHLLEEAGQKAGERSQEEKVE
jgi:hypothetical protein